MKKMIYLLAFAFLIAAGFPEQQSFAFLATSSITKLGFQIYGLYTSSDPTCQSNLYATVPLTSTPTSFDFTKATKLGTGPVPSPVNCVVLITTNTWDAKWAAGSYTSTSNSQSDGVCNSGGESIGPMVSNGTTITWPDQIAKDMATAGLSAVSVGTTSQSLIIPIFLSPYSECYGNLNVEDATCTTLDNGHGGPNFTSPPTGPLDTKGFHLTVPAAAQTAYDFVVDPSESVGYSLGICGTMMPIFKFKGITTIPPTTN